MMRNGVCRNRSLLFATMILISTGTLSSGFAQRPHTPPSAKQGLSGAQQAFALRVYESASRSNSGNLVTAPFGLYDLTAMLSIGADGETRRQFQQIMGNALPPKDLARELSRMKLAVFPLGKELCAPLQSNNGYGLRVKQSAALGLTDEFGSFRQGDLIFSIDGQPVRTVADVENLLQDAAETVAVSGYDYRQGRVFRRNVRLLRTRNTSVPAKGRFALFANAIWLDNAFKPTPTFRHHVEQSFGAKLFAADFGDLAAVSRSAESYFHQATQQRLSRLYPLAEFPVDTKLLVASLTDFNAEWELPFPANMTEAGVFASPDGQRVVSYMNQTEWFAYSENELFQIIRLPYQNSSLSMLILLPRRANDLDKLGSLFAQHPLRLQQLTSSLQYREVTIRLPRFRYSTHGSVKSYVSRLGLIEPFSRNADFSKMVSSGRIRLADIVQQTSIEVDERGTRAGSLTQALGVANSASQPLVFAAQHPFHFIVQDASGTIFFIGRVTHPTAGPDRRQIRPSAK